MQLMALRSPVSTKLAVTCCEPEETQGISKRQQQQRVLGSASPWNASPEDLVFFKLESGGATCHTSDMENKSAFIQV